ncbi:MAG: hypothetical protein PUB46_02930 [Lachnospiraceae bacterium]|uniref:hypothetical protein n=1 Tax=Roseburia hominis TaxID=301301 RepID=UPI001F3F51AE|nr:hypothetical protein [Roseburia hominis]MCI5711897.1 hypothetical protein [Lachnospiraceae bacterium]MDD6169019.1 hypothetical protein [Lachnospiraceae bacterium]MDY4837994.1 hypothetical protein [Lachnospiraceae bacterium]
MEKQTFWNRCLIVMTGIMIGMLVKSFLHIGRLEKKVKWLSQRLALMQLNIQK